VTCPTCKGQGMFQQVSQSLFGQLVRTQACPTCGGAGKVIEHPCKNCGGSGRELEERKLEVEIPAGIHDRQPIRISGEGHAAVAAAVPATFMCRCTCARTSASCARATISSRRWS